VTAGGPGTAGLRWLWHTVALTGAAPGATGTLPADEREGGTGVVEQPVVPGKCRE